MSVYLRTENGVLYHGDCMEHFKMILKGSVDMILCDLPYGTTNCDWDKKIELAPLWRAWNVCLKDNGVVCLTAHEIPLRAYLGKGESLRVSEREEDAAPGT